MERMETTAHTRLLGIIGTPIEHTLSPKMHSYFARKTGLDTVYLAFDVADGDFDGVIAAAKSMNALGFNITSPYKIKVIDSIDVLDPEAELMGTVNTIVNRDGKWHGYNTDGDGFVNSLEETLGSLKKKNILMLGAGGSARSVAYKFAQKGVDSVTISARNEQNINKIGDVIEKNTTCAFCSGIDEKQKYDIIVNTTPLGMHPHEEENPFSQHMDMLDAGSVCCDLIYNPCKTLFLMEAEQRGAKIVNGLPMLVMQGVYAYELFCGVKLGAECFDEAMQLFSEFII